MALEFTNHILDNVHGFIGLTAIEDAIERLDIFQRLRRLKQLGLTNWVFPGAEHTRYSHSLGVMHIIDLMAIKLGFSDDERQVLRLAGLLHDIGHYPLSHIGEYAYKASPVKGNDFLGHMAQKVKSSVDSLSEFDPIKKIEMVTASNKYHHERVAVDVINSSPEIAELLEKRFPDRDMKEVREDICDIITGNLERKIELSAMVQLLHSELDADRIDYLLRDASASGTSYGNFEVSALIKCLARRKHSKYDVEIVGVSPKGIGVADQFLISRFFAYSLIIYNKYASILQLMAQELIAWTAHTNMSEFPKPEDLLEWAKTHSSQPEYLAFTDQTFRRILEENTRFNRYACPAELQKIAQVLEHFRALDLAQGQSSIEFVGGDRSEIQEKLRSEKLYRDLINDQYLKEKKQIGLLSTASVTDQIPYDDFCAAYDVDRHPGNLDDYLIQRLQNGLALIPDDSDPILLVDCANSMVKDFSLYTRVILRAYQLPD